jgi:hypothetical protein
MESSGLDGYLSKVTKHISTVDTIFLGFCDESWI